MHSMQWHTLTAQELSDELDLNPASGLDQEQAAQRLAQIGPNRLRAEEKETLWEIFLEELREPMILLLLFTGLLYAIWGELSDTVVIFLVIVTMTGIEIFNERRAEKAITALRQLAEPTASVKRSGRVVEIPAEAIVPGDLILLQAGRRVPADAYLLEAYGLLADESALTGESTPVEKQAGLTMPAQTALADRANLLFAGTTIVRGRGTAAVVATGMTTELGRVAGLARQVKEPRTPLQQAMSEVSRSLVWLALGFSVIVPLLGVLLAGQPLQQMILTGLSLAFATIPEEMPIIITMVLALGGYRLSQQQAIAKQLKAVETLGAVTVIASDKTGTLTENRMQVSRFAPAELTPKMLEIGVLCNDAPADSLDHGAAPPVQTGDPLEVALLRAAREAGLDITALRQTYPLRDEFTFDTGRKMMSVIWETGDGLWVAVKGAPEAILARSVGQVTATGAQPLTDREREAILAAAAEMAQAGFRVLAFAERRTADDPLSQLEAESNLTFVGLAALADPPRPEVKAAIAACRQAGIRPVMITGDHPLTAQGIAAQVSLGSNGRILTGPELDKLSAEALQATIGQVSIYARTTPEHKLRLVQSLQQQGERVAVTGDGINDAPALAMADIGVAMGETGSDVAREAADLVLADDNFSTIVRAVAEGRSLFENLKKAVRYYLACKVALVSATLLPVLLSVPVPFAPIQIILMELFMDLAAAATFVAEPPEAGLMQRPPRNPRAPFMDRAMVSRIFTSAVGLFAAVSIAYLVTWYSGGNLARAQTVAFVTWLLGHVSLALNSRSERQPLLQLGLFSNQLMLLWGATTVAFILFVTLVPGVQVAFKAASLTGSDWALVIGAALLGTFWLEVWKWLTLVNS